MSTYRLLRCPRCGEEMRTYSNPIPTVDIIIEQEEGIVLIERKNAPHGWAIPGGFVDYGESLEEAAVREAAEETGLDVRLVFQLGTYSDPGRDPRFHTISTVFVATAEGRLRAGDDAVKTAVVRLDALPAELVFDHARILRDYLAFIRGQRPACPVVI
jgi:8-oxo-dGTP diphosphatase